LAIRRTALSDSVTLWSSITILPHLPDFVL
jgi:hypothetical protein